MGDSRTITSHIVAFVRQITVEPGVLLVAVGFFMFETTTRQAIYTKICYKEGLEYYDGLEPPCEGSKLTYDSDFHDKVGEKNASFTRIMTIASVLTPCLSVLILSAWGDLVGRKINILLGTTGIILQVFATIIVIGLPSCPVWVLLVSHFVFGCLGIFPLAISSAAQYITDIVADKRMLAVRMTIVVALMSIGITVGNVLAAETIPTIGYDKTLIISLACLCGAFVYFLLATEQVPPIQLARKQRIVSDMSVQGLDRLDREGSQEGLVDGGHRKPGCIGGLKFIWSLLVDIWRTYTKPRPHNRRLWLFTIIFAYLFLGMGFQGINSFLVIYTRDDPLNMGPKQYGLFVAAQGIASFVGSILVSIVLKVLHVRDTTTLMVSLLSSACGAVVYATATTQSTFFIAAGVGCLGFLGYAVFQSFVAQLVAPEEVGKVLAGESIVMSVASIFGSLILSSVYKTLKEHKSTLRSGPVLIAIGFDLIALLITFGVHIGTRKLLRKTPSVKPPLGDTAANGDQRVATIGSFDVANSPRPEPEGAEEGENAINGIEGKNGPTANATGTDEIPRVAVRKGKKLEFREDTRDERY